MALIGSQGEGPLKNLQGEETQGLSEGLQKCLLKSMLPFKDKDFR